MSIWPSGFRRTESLIFLIAGALCAMSCASPGRSAGNSGGSGGSLAEKLTLQASIVERLLNYSQ